MWKLIRLVEDGGVWAVPHKKLFGGAPKAPQPVIREPDPLPPPPSLSDEETASLAEENRKANTPRRGGRAATFLTPGGTTQQSSAVRFLGAGAAT